MKTGAKLSDLRPKGEKAMTIVEANEDKREPLAADTARDAALSKAPLGDQGPGNVNKIRDILFGSQMRDYELRFARLEEGLRKESSDLREITKKRVDALETYIKNELELLQSRLKSEKDERSGADAQIAAELKNTAALLTKKIGDAEDQNAQAHCELRNELLRLSKELSDEIRAKTDELATVLARRVEELRNDKTDRAMLASLLTEVAMQLTGEFRVPAAE